MPVRNLVNDSLVENTVSSMHQSENTSSTSSAVQHHAYSPLHQGSDMQEFETQTSSATTFSTPIGTVPLLPVLDPAQLQVIFPFPSYNPMARNCDVSNVTTGIQTRLKTEVITRQDYSSFIARFPELSSLQIEPSLFSTTPMDHCGFSFLADIRESEEPKHFRAASKVTQWQQAMQEEFNALKAQGTWILVPLPSNREVIGSKWVYKIKRNSDGTISKYKARLMAQGFSQNEGLDYSETFSPVVRHTTVRIILALATQFNWNLRQLDIKNAFLHGDIEEEAPRAWNSKFTSFLPALGFKTALSDSSLFVKVDDGDVILLLLYVDNIILTGSSSQKIQSVITNLAEVFDLKVMGRLTYFLGWQIHYHSDGSLMYLTFTRPDIAHSVNVVCQYMTYPTDMHMHLVKRIMKYLQGTLDCGLKYTKTSDFHITAYSDSNWATDINTRRSITGFVVFIGSNPVSWQSKKQATVSRSSTEAEYKALAHCVADI
ncbi:hypothetical protein ACFX11_017881 [Malus domestica]